VTTLELAESYLHKARVRLRLLAGLRADREFSDVIRIAQECVELALKASLRQVGVDPPKWHDVGPVLIENAHLFPEDVRPELPGIAESSASLRRDRELSFYGDVDFVPTREYGDEEAQAAIAAADRAVRFASMVIEGARYRVPR